MTPPPPPNEGRPLQQPPHSPSQPIRGDDDNNSINDDDDDDNDVNMDELFFNEPSNHPQPPTLNTIRYNAPISAPAAQETLTSSAPSVDAAATTSATTAAAFVPPRPLAAAPAFVVALPSPPLATAPAPADDHATATTNTTILPQDTTYTERKDFHRLLVIAILNVGVQYASPNKIAHTMTQSGPISCQQSLTMEQIKSHLQRYRKVYERVEKPRFLDDYDKFDDVLERLQDHNQRPGAFALLDLDRAVGGRAAAVLSHMVQQQQFGQDDDLVDQFGFVRSHHVRATWKSQHNIDGRTRTSARLSSMSLTDQKITPLPLRDAILIREPVLTEAEQASPLGLALQQVVGLIQCYGEYLNEGRGGTMNNVDNAVAAVENSRNDDADGDGDRAISDYLEGYQTTNLEEGALMKEIQAGEEDAPSTSPEMSLFGDAPDHDAAHLAAATNTATSFPSIGQQNAPPPPFGWPTLLGGGPNLGLQGMTALRQSRVSTDRSDGNVQSNADSIEMNLGMLQNLAMVNSDKHELDALRRLVTENDRLRRENERLRQQQAPQQGHNDADGRRSLATNIVDDDSDDETSTSSSSSIDEDDNGLVSHILDGIPNLDDVFLDRSRTAFKPNAKTELSDNCSCCSSSSDICVKGFDFDFLVPEQNPGANTSPKLEFLNDKTLRGRLEALRTERMGTRDINAFDTSRRISDVSSIGNERKAFIRPLHMSKTARLFGFENASTAASLPPQQHIQHTLPSHRTTQQLQFMTLHQQQQLQQQQQQQRVAGLNTSTRHFRSADLERLSQQQHHEIDMQYSKDPQVLTATQTTSELMEAMMTQNQLQQQQLQHLRRLSDNLKDPQQQQVLLLQQQDLQQRQRSTRFTMQQLQHQSLPIQEPNAVDLSWLTAGLQQQQPQQQQHHPRPSVSFQRQTGISDNHGNEETDSNVTRRRKRRRSSSTSISGGLGKFHPVDNADDVLK